MLGVDINILIPSFFLISGKRNLLCFGEQFIPQIDFTKFFMQDSQRPKILLACAKLSLIIVIISLSQHTTSVSVFESEKFVKA